MVIFLIGVTAGFCGMAIFLAFVRRRRKHEAQEEKN